MCVCVFGVFLGLRLSDVCLCLRRVSAILLGVCQLSVFMRLFGLCLLGVRLIGLHLLVCMCCWCVVVLYLLSYEHKYDSEIRGH